MADKKDCKPKPCNPEMKLTEELLKLAALASFDNARSLYESAMLLTQNGKAPAATALAVIGEEEFAKAVVYTIAAAVPEQRRVLGARLRDLREHNVKHILTGMADGAQIVNSEGWAVARQEGWPLSSEDRLTDMFETLASYGIDELITPREKAKTYYENLQKEMSVPWAADLPPSDPSKLKEAALYVDVGLDGRLSTPDRVVDCAASQILGLQYFLDEFHVLAQVLEDDKRWVPFADRVSRAAGRAESKHPNEGRSV